MWIQFNNAFLSIVENRDNKLELLVRARIKGDIEKIFPEADVFKDDDADYKYRALISKVKVAARMMLKMTEINYDNFKNSVKEIERKNAYSNVWIELRKLQK
tara:strand:- start:10687 stop:10992 length:306 start_codon:yes stop_codon:yes gene_type:complete